MESELALNQDFNLSTAAKTTVLELSEAIWHKIHKGAKPFNYISDPPYPYDVQFRSPDTDKAARVLGFKAETSLSEILDEVIPWIEQQVLVGEM